MQRRSRDFYDFFNDWDNYANVFGNTLTIPWIGIYSNGYM